MNDQIEKIIEELNTNKTTPMFQLIQVATIPIIGETRYLRLFKDLPGDPGAMFPVGLLEIIWDGEKWRNQ